MAHQMPRSRSLQIDCCGTGSGGMQICGQPPRSSGLWSATAQPADRTHHKHSLHGEHRVNACCAYHVALTLVLILVNYSV